MTTANIHTKKIQRVKLLLPLFGVLLLGLVFVFNWDDQQRITDQFSGQDSIFQTPELSAEKPELNIETADGDQMHILADGVEAIDQTQTQFSGQDISGELTVGGAFWDIDAASGSANTKTQDLHFGGGVDAWVDKEYHIETDNLEGNTEKNLFSSNKPVTVTSEDFMIRSDSAKVQGEQGSRVIEFDGNVRGTFLMDMPVDIDE